MALPIQKLPFLVIQFILQTMGFVDFFLLTRTSTKMKRIFKNINSAQKHRLFVTIGECVIIQIQSNTNLKYAEAIYLMPEESKLNRSRMFNMGIGSVDRLSSAFFLYDGFSLLETFWKDTKAGCIEFCNELIDVYQAPIRGVILNLEVDNYQNEINWVNSMFPGLNTFAIKGKCSLRDYKWMMKNAKATERFEFHMEPAEWTDEIGNHEVVPLKIKTVFIENARWISVQQLEAISGSVITVRDINLSDPEINKFLRNLKSSKEMPKFDELHISFYEPADPNVVLEGLTSREADAFKPEDVWSGFVFENGSGQKCTIVYCQFESPRPDFAMVGFKIRIGG